MEILLVFASILGIWIWGSWWFDIIRANSIAQNRALRIAMAVLPLACGAGVVATLLLGSSFDVRGDVVYIFLYLGFGSGWVGSSVWIAKMMGISPIEDVLDRRNTAALWAAGGALAGIAACYAGANVGDGPGPEVVIFCAFLATSGLFLSWWILQTAVDPGLLDRITIGREVSEGQRLAGFLSANGIILGYAVAGDWAGYESAAKDILWYGWPVLVLLGAEFGLSQSRHGQGNEDETSVSNSRLWGFFYLLFGVAYPVVRSYIL